MVKNRFSGWRVLAGCFLCMFFIQSSLQTFAIFMPQIAAGTGWPVSQVAIVSSTAAGGAFLANLLLPKMLKRISPKYVLLIGAVMLIFHQCLYSFCSSVYMLWFSGFLGGFAIGWGTAAPCTIIVTNWFVKNRSQYVAVVAAAAMFGSVLINPVAGELIAGFGWRRAYQILSFLVGVPAISAIFFLIVDAPAKKGQLPYGAQEAANTQAGAVDLSGVEPAEARRSASYWLLLIGIFFIGLSTNVENYMPTFWQASGLEPVVSSYMMSAYALIAAVCSIVMGQINDRLGGKNFVLITSAMFSLSVLIMSYTKAVSSLPSLILCCVPFAVGSKKASVMTPPLVVAEAFGRKHYAVIIGTFTAMLQFGIAASNLVIGRLLPLGYPVTFTVMVAVNLLGMACMFTALLRKPHKEG